MLKEIDEEQEDINYWLSKSPIERFAALTMIIRQSLKPGERMDKTFVVQRQMHP